MFPDLVLVLVITIDTLRLDALASMPQTAERLRSFHEVAEFRTPTPLTLPAHASLWSGLSPHHHGVRNNGNYRLAESVYWVPEQLSSEGFRSAAFVSSRVLARRYGLARGFARYHEPPPGLDELPAQESIAQALAYLDGAVSEGPTLVWLHLFDPHAPYRTELGGISKAPSAYYDEVRRVDHELERLWQWLDATALWGRTIVVLTADHGEGLGDHGEPQHGVFLYEPTVRIPFFLHAPGDITLREQGSLLDVAPTLLELLGRAPATDLDGESLLHPCERPLLLESVAPREAFGWQPTWGVVWNGHKLVQREELELYHVADDPLERHDLAGEQASRSRQGQALMAEMVTAETAAWVEPDPSLVALGYVLPRPELASRSLDRSHQIAILAGLNDCFFAASAGDWAAVLAAAERVLEADAENIAGLTYLVDAAGRLGRAVASDRLGALDPQRDATGASALVLARFHQARGEPDQAQRLYALAVQHNELLLEARLALIGQLLARGRPEAAREHLARLSALAPGSSYERLGRVLVALARGELVPARALLDEVPDGQRGDPQYWLLRGYVEFRSGRQAAALTAFERALALGHVTPELLLSLGALAIELDRPAAAADTFRHFLGLYPSHSEAANVRELVGELAAVQEHAPAGQVP